MHKYLIPLGFFWIGIAFVGGLTIALRPLVLERTTKVAPRELSRPAAAVKSASLSAPLSTRLTVASKQLRTEVYVKQK